MTGKGSDPNRLPSEDAQQRFWNEWNEKYRGVTYDPNVDPPTRRRQDTALAWVQQLALKNPRILDLGCATGWLTDQLAAFGSAVGIDIADASIREARQRFPRVRFECTDLVSSREWNGAFDIVVSLETLSHVVDQRKFIERTREALRPGGYLILTTQNRVVFERRSDVTPLAPGQIRQWLSPHQLRRLLKDDFRILHLTTLIPEGRLGFLRVVNSTRLKRVLCRFVSSGSMDRAKERFGLGQTIAVLAQRN